MPDDSTDEEWYREPDKPLVLTLTELSYLFEIAVLADKLYNGIIERKLDGQLMRELAVALYSRELHSTAAFNLQERGPAVDQDLLETDFVRAELKNKAIYLWEETPDGPNSTTHSAGCSGRRTLSD